MGFEGLIITDCLEMHAISRVRHSGGRDTRDRSGCGLRAGQPYTVGADGADYGRH